MKKKKRRLPTIGWKETVDFPVLELSNIEVKVDTGAKTSVLHCSVIEQVKRYRKNYVRFIPLDPSFPQYQGREFVMPYHSERTIKNSFGIEENRFIILTKLRLHNKIHFIELSLRDRSNLEFPVLLGRSAIRKKYLVDVARSNLSRKAELRREARKIKNSLTDISQ